MMSLVLIFDDGFQFFQQKRSNLEFFLKFLAAAITLWFQLEDMVLLIGTLVFFDPILLPIYEA